MRFLGIDYGTKRIGVAISDENGTLAFPKGIVKNNGELFGKIERILSEERISEIVMGESLDFAGLPNALVKEVDFFIGKTKKKFKLPVHLEKEFWTSVEARRYQQGQVDASAAALILQRYLDKRNKNISGKSRNVV